MSNTSSTSFEFRISSMRFFHRSFSDSTPLLSFTFLSSFPLSPIHSSSPFTLSFLSAPPPLLPLLRSSRCSLSLSLSILTLPRWTRATQCLSARLRGVATSRERVCVGHRGAWWGLWENSHAGDCVPAASGAQPSVRGILLDFLLSRSKSVSPRTQKKGE